MAGLKNKAWKTVFSVLMFGFVISFMFHLPVNAEGYGAGINSISYEGNAYSSLYTNENTGYGVFIVDTADYLADWQEEALVSSMAPITSYGYVVFYSRPTTEQDIGKMSEWLALDCFGSYVSSVVLAFDPSTIYIYSEGDLYDTIGKNYSRTITDNVYKKAPPGQEYEGSVAAYEMIYQVLDGQRIAQPMKYICNGLLAVLLALFFNFLIVHNRSKLKSASDDELLAATTKSFRFHSPEFSITHSDKVYSPRSSGGGSGGHGGGGGGHHGGGGGHSR